jgi:hypothetical protein
MENQYHVTDPNVGNGHYESSMIEFNGHVASFDEIRNKRLKLNLLSVAASILKDRTPSGPISFREVIQADSLLFLRGYFPITNSYGVWAPRCFPYAERGSAGELFARAGTDRGFEPLKILLNVKTRKALMEGIDAAVTGSRTFHHHLSLTLGYYLNYSDLNRMSGRKVEAP